MLSYQHAYHAGNAADVHKHALLASALAYMTGKDKALSYLETHAGRGLYDLAGPEAQKTGEAAHGVARRAEALPADHPYRRALEAVRADHGPTAYPGSPLIAAHLLRPFDRVHLAELHPGEHRALATVLPKHPNRFVYHRDGLDMAKALTPPDPRRGLLLMDPAYEQRDEYGRLAALLPKLARKWNVGVLMLWYPILADRRHRPMLRNLRTALPEAKVHEVAFPPARKGHGMTGSGMFIVNPPWGLDRDLPQIDALFAT